MGPELTRGASSGDVRRQEHALSRQHVIVATGARARELPKRTRQTDGKRNWTTASAWPRPRCRPALVIGSGAIASSSPASTMTSVRSNGDSEMLDRVVPVRSDARPSRESLKKQGMKI